MGEAEQQQDAVQQLTSINFNITLNEVNCCIRSGHMVSLRKTEAYYKKRKATYASNSDTEKSTMMNCTCFKIYSPSSNHKNNIHQGNPLSGVSLQKSHFRKETI